MALIREDYSIHSLTYNSYRINERTALALNSIKPKAGRTNLAYRSLFRPCNRIAKDRFHTLPEVFCPGKIKGACFLINTFCQKCRIQVPLHPDTTTDMPSLAKGFLNRLFADMAYLGQFCCLCWKFKYVATSIFSFYFEAIHEHGWGTHINCPAVSFLPAFIRYFFSFDSCAHCDYFVYIFSVKGFRCAAKILSVSAKSWLTVLYRFDVLNFFPFLTVPFLL